MNQAYFFFRHPRHNKSPRRPVSFRGREELGTLPNEMFIIMSNHLLYVLGHHRHPRGKPFDADPVRLCQTLARKGAVETRFEAVSGRSEANVPARLGPLRFVGACRLAWRSGQISDSETDLLRAAENPSPSGRGSLPPGNFNNGDSSSCINPQLTLICMVTTFAANI